MIAHIVTQWYKNNKRLQPWFEEVYNSDTLTPLNIVKAVFREVVTTSVSLREGYVLDILWNNITSTEHIEYKGDYVFLIPFGFKDIRLENYLYTHMSYGSCSGCDLMVHIKSLSKKEAIEALYSLALHIVQETSYLLGRETTLGYASLLEPEEDTSCYKSFKKNLKGGKNNGSAH